MEGGQKRVPHMRPLTNYKPLNPCAYQVVGGGVLTYTSPNTGQHQDSMVSIYRQSPVKIPDIKNLKVLY